MPTEDLGDLSEETIELFKQKINAGEKPTAIALSWVEMREIHGEWPECFIANVMLDGHP